jgi:hypothetical protein
VEEHLELERLLDHLDISKPSDQQALRTARAELSEHISKEEDGHFPASLTALDGDGWNASMRARQEAHPGAASGRGCRRGLQLRPGANTAIGPAVVLGMAALATVALVAVIISDAVAN